MLHKWSSWWLCACQNVEPLILSYLVSFPLFLIVPQRRIFMFQFWKSITWWRVPSSSSFATVWVFSKDSRWLGILLSRRMCSFLCSSVFLDTHYSITHAPAAPVSIFWRKCLNKLFMLVAIENEKPFRVSLQSPVLISLQYSISERVVSWWSD